jgi:hypothetical protein
MSSVNEQLVELVTSLQSALKAQLELNASIMRRLNALETHAVQTGEAVLKLLKEQHGGDACGRHCACKAGEM